VFDDAGGADFHGGLAAEEVQQNGDALLAGQDLRDDRFKAMKGPPGDPNLVAFGKTL
jgi:hypothetical protein